jgi:hypothetical protein
MNPTAESRCQAPWRACNESVTECHKARVPVSLAPYRFGHVPVPGTVTGV